MRLALLFVDGVLNYIFLVQFDVLRAYAIVGLVVALGLLVLIEVVSTITSAVPSFILPGEFPVFEGRPTHGQTVVTAGLTVFGDLTLGVPLDIALRVLAPERAFERFSSSTLVAFGILALVARSHHGREVGFVGRRLSSVGRMALSCYVVQNLLGRIVQELILGSSISSRVDPVLGTVASFAVIAVVLVVFAEVWLRVFRRGPLEAVWDVAFRTATRERHVERRQAQAQG